MKNRLDILDEEILKLIKENNAKPNKTIEEHILDLLEVLDLLLELGYIKNYTIYDLVEKACIYHDLGKLNKEFQKRVNSKKIRFNEEKEVVHNILSLYFIDSKKFKSTEDYLKVAISVFNHHSYCNNFDEMTKKEELIRILIENFKIYELDDFIKSDLADMVEDNDAIKIKGYLHKCDYSASAERVAEYKNDFLSKSLEMLLNKWKIDNKKASWNDLQYFCKENKDENIIAIAQTGMGKTEAGLLWIGDTKGFFVLPVRAAINAIYDRVRNDILENKSIDERVAILHSSSLEYYMKIFDKSNEFLNEYNNMGKSLSIPLNISTMDQIFDFLYKYPEYELKLTILSYSKIVIDEIQAYGPDLLAYLICGIEKIVEFGGKVAILTATLPPFIKDLLKKNINFKENKTEFINDMKRHNLKVIDKKLNVNDIYQKYIENKKLNKSNKILVVCNSIRESINLYEELISLIDETEEVNILHSKFIRKDRAKKECEILRFGRTYDENKNIDKQNGIWISTSIVEASLDIDFDYLFTELRDLNSLFQRLGRCNRKGKKENKDYNCYIYTKIDYVDLINGNVDKVLFDLSKEAIRYFDGKISEKDKINLINTYLTTDNLKESDYLKKYREKYRYINKIKTYEFKKNEENLRDILSEDVIPSPIYIKYIDEIKKIEEGLNSINTSKEEKRKLRNKLMEYTVSVSLWDINNYDRVLLSKYKNDYIKVIECEYGDVGYKSIKYNNETRNSVIWDS
ncbi:MAG: CRISPR-associated helicase Cas3' [Clostridium sp.]|uniref:CRISPR-associated helicase Cas3' n=2 Tax=Clostridium TaxID=1485 RepID=UPI0025BA2A3E|nr:CRISPR-associated helicase Cas3' [Clostridium sp.]MCI9302669.1 CRISPR-associated helicase Cas3' [Clostridium sp.]